MLSYGVVQRLLAFLQFGSSLLRRREDQIGMAECVVADRMTSLGDFARDVRPLFNIAADQEKCSMDIVLSQSLQQMQSMWIVGTIVVGQSELLRGAGR